MNTTAISISETPPAHASADAAWARIPTTLDPRELARLCQDIEVVFRLNPYLMFKDWQTIDNRRYHVAFTNLSNQQDVELDFEVVIGPADGLTIRYDRGLKKSTVFTVETTAQGSTLVIVDDYDRLPEQERTRRSEEVDKSLRAWATELYRYFARAKRWSWLPGWRWYMRRVWIPMTPSARRIVWMVYLIGMVEFLFFLFVLFVYRLELDKL